MQNMPPQPAGNFAAPQPPAKKGMSKGCIIGIVVAAVLVVGLVVLLAAGGAGFYWLSKQASNENARAGSGGTSGGATGRGGGSSSAADAPRPTDAQTAAVAGGQSAVWDQQEISWTVPQRWSKSEVSSQSFMWRSPGGAEAASLIVSVAPMAADFPTEISATLSTIRRRRARRTARWTRCAGSNSTACAA